MNKYLHTVASVGFLFTFNYDARNHELKIDRHFPTVIAGPNMDEKFIQTST